MSDPYSIVDAASGSKATEPKMSHMGGNLFWYVPLFLFVIGYFVVPNISAGYTNIRLVFRHWKWILLVSPSAYVFFSLVVYSVCQPIQFLMFIPAFFSEERGTTTFDRRYLLSFLVVISLIVLVFLLQLAIHSSFPFCWQADGVERLRLVPFLPCPK